MLRFDRSLCTDLNFAASREWLVTNGIGGFACGTLAGILTRRYHGYLVAALTPPLGRTLLVSKFDDYADYAGVQYPLFSNQWDADTIEPTGYHFLESFHLDGTIPTWTYALGDALLEKKIWMQQGANTTYVRYSLPRTSFPLRLHLKALVNYRDYHSTTAANEWHMQIRSIPHGLQVNATAGATPFFILSSHAEATPHHIWTQGFYRAVEVYRGDDDREDHLYAGDFVATLSAGHSLTLVMSTDATPSLDGDAAYNAQKAYETGLLARSIHHEPTDGAQQLVLAADQFIVRRPTPDDPDGKTVIAGYPWFTDWGRDTMISLNGLTLSTGRPDVARRILRVFSHYVSQGMLPNRFPDAGEEPEYNTVDATLWYFEAIRAYYASTRDTALIGELFPILQDIIAWHMRGTRYQIHVDEKDGLLYSGESGVQLTWMDAKVGDWVVTPRTGKAVEINALWYNALKVMASLAQTIGQNGERYENLAQKTQAGFARFWNEGVGYCYDVLDTPTGNDAALRPNQIFAVSLPHSPLNDRQQKAVVDVCTRYLLTPHGLRSLAPHEPGYIGKYGGTLVERDAAYHQGTVWSWLIGPYVFAHRRIYQNDEMARSFLQPLMAHLAGNCIGSINEIFDGNAPFVPRGCFAQAWSVAELLRAWQVTLGKESVL